MNGKDRRTTELGLILLGLVIIGAAYTLAGLGSRASLPADVVPFLVMIVVLVLIAHLAVRRLAPNADGIILPVVALLNGLGYVFIARIDQDLAVRQAGWTAAGVVAFVATLALVRRVKSLADYGYTLLFLGLGLLLLPLLPVIGKTINGARIWIGVGPFSVQPAEFAKIALILFFATYLVTNRELLGLTNWRVGPLHLPAPKFLAPVLLAWGVALLIMVVQTDLGSALLFFVLFLSMLWIATERLIYPVVGGLLFGVGATLAWTQLGHVQDRVAAWLNPWDLADGSGFQIVQGTYALAWGGIGGQGLGRGYGIQGLGKAFVATDSIFVIIGEELGIFGSTAVLAAFLLIAGAGFRIAMRADDPYHKLLAAGLTVSLSFQAFVILGGLLRVLPLTGITLPFLSYGGSSLIANYVLVALLLRTSDEVSTRAEGTARGGRVRVGANV
ncbi:MAG: FtsW/RodA/SpoVE family cell cycle protein [Candidatus Neomicrothrix subdominans]|jgi:cell division protein FtsW (lipid II flippase)|nr:FtsW/RodA/SpoVE family cell cycle protein [Candidatus Microthrix sp.]